MNFAGRGLAVVYSSLAGVGRKAANLSEPLIILMRGRAMACLVNNSEEI